MNIDIKELEQKRDKLENRYTEIEDKICSWLMKNEDYSKEIKILEEEQQLIDQQIDLLDHIIDNLNSTPILYEEFNKINKDYKKVVGD